MVNRRRRTLQYAPADNPDKVQAAAESAADAVIIDLESTVDPGDKDWARQQLASYRADLHFDDQEVVVRINDLRGEHWEADIAAALDADVDTLRLPKIEAPGEVTEAVGSVTDRTDQDIEFLLQLESPRGLLNGREIAFRCAEFPAVTGIGVGMGDYTKALGLDGHTPELRAFLLNRTAAYAAVGGMDALAYVHKDRRSLRRAAELARSLGHVGQPVSHTVDRDAFIAVLNDVYGEPGRPRTA